MWMYFQVIYSEPRNLWQEGVYRTGMKLTPVILLGLKLINLLP